MKILLTIEKRQSLSTNNSIFYIVFHSIASYSTVFRPILLYCIVLYCIVSYCIVLYCIVLYCVLLYCIVLYCIVFCCIVLYYILFYHILLYSKSTLLLFSSSCAYLPSKCSSKVSKSLSISISALAQSQIVFTYLQIVQMW